MDQAERASRRLGAALVLASTVPFALSGVFTRLITADVWTVLAWRGFIGGLAVLAYVRWWQGGGPRARLGLAGWGLATVGSLASIAFLGAFRLTFVANVALIYAMSPFAAAALEWLFLRERVRGAVLRTALVTAFGVAIIVAGGLGAPHLLGDGVALAMMALFALYTVLIRVFRGVPAVTAAAASSLQLAALGSVVGAPLRVSGHDLAWLVAFGLSFALAVILWTEGARRIPAAETGLLGGAETPFAVLFAWVILAEVPPATTLFGGSIVLAAVLWRALADRRAAVSSSAR